MSWDPLQREVLAELGHAVYVTAGAATRSATAAAAVDGAEPANVDAALRAVLRAAGRAPDDAQALALCRDWLPPGGLRDPAARRALWPRLRALRARPAG